MSKSSRGYQWVQIQSMGATWGKHGQTYLYATTSNWCPAYNDLISPYITLYHNFDKPQSWGPEIPDRFWLFDSDEMFFSHLHHAEGLCHSPPQESLLGRRTEFLLHSQMARLRIRPYYSILIILDQFFEIRQSKILFLNRSFSKPCIPAPWIHPVLPVPCCDSVFSVAILQNSAERWGCFCWTVI